PACVYLENSPALTYRGGVRIIADLAELGYVGKWGIVGADACDLEHHRARFWLVAHAQKVNGDQRYMLGEGGLVSQGKYRRFPRATIAEDWRTADQGPFSVSIFRDPADGLAAEVDELAALGNGQVPLVAATAFNILR